MLLHALRVITEFMDKARQRNLTIDIINLRWFASPYSLDYFEAFVRDAQQRINNQTIWLTEFGMDRDYGNETAVLGFMRKATVLLEFQSGFPRYAWFGSYPNNLLNADSSGLSERGDVWDRFRGVRYLYYDYKARRSMGSAALERPADIATPEELAAYKNQQLAKAFDEDWLRKIRGDSG